MGASHETASSSASSQEIASNLFSPRRPARLSGVVIRAGEGWCFRPALLGARHSMIGRMIAVVVDVVRLPILEMNPYAATAGAQVAGGGDISSVVAGMRAIRYSIRRPVSATGLFDMDSPSGMEADAPVIKNWHGDNPPRRVPG